MVFPFMVKAVTADDEEIDLSKYKTLNFTQILEEEKIEIKDKNYKETDDQMTIYLFRGNGCGYCRAFLNFLNDNLEEYGKYFKVVGFEVWNDRNNSDLLGNVSAFLEQDAGGVPYIIIGKQVFAGFTDSYGDSIKSTIKSEYESTNKYNVFTEYNNAVKAAKRAEFIKSYLPVILNFVFVCAGVVVVCMFVKKQNEQLLKRINKQSRPVKVDVKRENYVEKDDNTEVEKVIKKKNNNKKRK